jgi:hypothetical protein
MSNKTRNPQHYVIGDDIEVSDVDLAGEAVYVNGERLTDERVERMAEESVRLARIREANLIPGGKSLSGGSKHSPIVQTRVPDVMHVKLRRIADDRHVSMSKLLREALDDLVEREETHLS